MIAAQEQNDSILPPAAKRFRQRFAQVAEPNFEILDRHARTLFFSERSNPRLTYLNQRVNFGVKFQRKLKNITKFIWETEATPRTRV